MVSKIDLTRSTAAKEEQPAIRGSNSMEDDRDVVFHTEAGGQSGCNCGDRGRGKLSGGGGWVAKSIYEHRLNAEEH